MQTPAPLDYARAHSVDEALRLLVEHGPDAAFIAGGHSLIPMMRIRLAQPEWVIDINDLTELDYIRIDGQHLAIGALTRHVAVLDSALLAEHYSIFRDAERVIADPIVRNRGTVGGSIAQADPAEDLATVAVALKASVVLRSPTGSRTVPVREFIDGPFMTLREENEILTELRVQVRPGVGSSYQKVERRAGDWAVASAGAMLVLDGDTIADAGIGLAAVGAPHHCAPAAEDYLMGRPAIVETFVEAGRLAAAASNPQPDQRGPARYKKHLAAELTVRALTRAAARAKGRG